MNQAQEIEASAPGHWSKPLAIVVIAPAQATVDAVRNALARMDCAWEIVHAANPAAVVSPEQVGSIALYCLQCASSEDEAQRELSLVRNLAGDAPVLLLDAGRAGWDGATAVAAGAWDLCPIAQADILETRLRQALEIGRRRIELHDIGQRLNQAQRRLDVLLSQGQDARASLIDHRIVDVSAACARLLGMDDANATRGLDLLERVAPHETARVSEALEQVARDKTDTALVFDLLTHGDQRQSVRALLQPGVDEDSGKRRVNVVFQTTDSGRAPLGDLSRKPGQDGRMALHGVLAQTGARAQERVLGLIFVAVDEISTLQDQMGLAQSDLVLQEVGLFLLQNVRGEDRLFRFGAGEYVMLIERHSRSEIAESAQRIHALLGNEVFGDERRSATLSASVAHITLGGDAADNDRRLQTVMDAAYDLREAGGNACQECGGMPAEESDHASSQQWTQRLQQALSQDRFSLAYQGITSLAGDSQPYFDCLLRYVDDRGALVRPGEFLPAAEQAGLMPDIDQWVVRRAIDVIAQQRAKDTHIALFVKLSAATLGAGAQFLTWIEEIARTRPIPRHQLILSMREDDVRSQTRAARKLAAELDAQGFRIALTHYGSTPKATQVLDHMPAAFIKLAPDFARQMLGSAEDERLNQVIATARERQIPLIAEQIEDANSMARLWQAGVNYVQGHFIQEPDTEALAHTESRLG